MNDDFKCERAEVGSRTDSTRCMACDSCRRYYGIGEGVDTRTVLKRTVHPMTATHLAAATDDELFAEMKRRKFTHRLDVLDDADRRVLRKGLTTLLSSEVLPEGEPEILFRLRRILLERDREG